MYGGWHWKGIPCLPKAQHGMPGPLSNFLFNLLISLQATIRQMTILCRSPELLKKYRILYGFYMILIFNMISYDLCMILYAFYMILYAFYMISYCFIWSLEVGPQFSNDPIFSTNVFLDFERSTGHSDYHRIFRMTFFSINVFLDFERSTGHSDYHRNFRMNPCFDY